jgi:hypothetical protein
VKCCLRAALSSAVLELPAKGSQAPRAACGYGALVCRFTACRYSAAAGDALRCIGALVRRRDSEIQVIWMIISGNCNLK